MFGKIQVNFILIYKIFVKQAQKIHCPIPAQNATVKAMMQ